MKDLEYFFKKKTTGFFLLMTLYDEKDPRRQEEFLYCLKRNMDHSMVHKIYIFYEQQNEKNNHSLMKQIDPTHRKIEIFPIKTRPSYRNLFEFANQNLESKNIIIANSDIYFEKSLCKLEGYDFSEKFLVLTRWNVADNNKLYLQSRKNPVYPWRKTSSRKLRNKPRMHNTKSADVWIFRSPIATDFDCDQKIGTYLCDSLLNHSLLQAQSRGTFRVFNPCLSIKACHVDKNHHNKNRDFKDTLKKVSPEIIEKAKSGRIPWCRIKDTY